MKFSKSHIITLLTISAVLIAFTSTAMAESVIGKFSEISDSIKLHLTIQQPPPSSIIVELTYQPQAQITAVKPNTKKINSKAGTLKWHIKKPRVGKSTLSASFDRQIAKNSVRATLRYKSGKNGNMTQTVITP